MLLATLWGLVAALAVRGAIAIWKAQTSKPSTIVEPGAKPSDHEQRLVKLEYKFHALELEWEDTRAKFLGMTRSFIRQAKAAGLDTTPAADGDGGLQPQAPSGAAAGVLSSRAAVLSTYRRNRNAAR